MAGLSAGWGGWPLFSGLPQPRDVSVEERGLLPAATGDIPGVPNHPGPPDKVRLVPGGVSGLLKGWKTTAGTSCPEVWHLSGQESVSSSCLPAVCPPPSWEFPSLQGAHTDVSVMLAGGVAVGVVPCSRQMS